MVAYHPYQVDDAREAMGNLDRSGIEKATRLLAKAGSTDSDDEAIALALRSYALLAETINAYDLAREGPPKGARRRERRMLSDRRSAMRGSGEPAGEDRGVEQEAAVDGYARLGNGGVRVDHAVDFPL